MARTSRYSPQKVSFSQQTAHRQPNLVLRLNKSPVLTCPYSCSAKKLRLVWSRYAASKPKLKSLAHLNDRISAATAVLTILLVQNRVVKHSGYRQHPAGIEPVGC